MIAAARDEDERESETAEGSLRRGDEIFYDRVERLVCVFAFLLGKVYCTARRAALAIDEERRRRALKAATGGVAFAGRIEIAASPLDYGYRARTRVHRRGVRTGYRRRRSHAVQAVGRCPVLTPERDAELRALFEAQRAEDKKHRFAAGNARRLEEQERKNPVQEIVREIHHHYPPGPPPAPSRPTTPPSAGRSPCASPRNSISSACS